MKLTLGSHAIELPPMTLGALIEIAKALDAELAPGLAASIERAVRIVGAAVRLAQPQTSDEEIRGWEANFRELDDAALAILAAAGFTPGAPGEERPAEA